MTRPPRAAARRKPASPSARPVSYLAARPTRLTPRTSAGMSAYERAIDWAGLSPVAGIDEAGRGACAGPLVVAAAIVGPDGRTSIPGLADSKELTPLAREAVYQRLVQVALAWHVVVIPPADIDRLGLHVCNITGMRRALAGLRRTPGFVITDGFPVRGLGVPSLGMWKGDQAAACVAAASVLAKVTRDRIMSDLDEFYPGYGFNRHKGYCTADHRAALMELGPCPVHRFSYQNVAAAVRARAGQAPPRPGPGQPDGGTLDVSAPHEELADPGAVGSVRVAEALIGS